MPKKDLKKLPTHLQYRLFISKTFLDLKPASRMILILMYYKVNNDSNISLPYKEIRECLGYTDMTIWRSISDILSHGFIEMIACDNSDTSSTFTISDKWKIWEPGDIIFSRKKNRENSQKPGHIYILKKANGMIKIGISVNPKARIHGIETMAGERFTESWISEKCNCFAQVEINAHNYYNKFRIIGEWFNIDFEKAIKYCKKNINSITYVNV